MTTALTLKITSSFFFPCTKTRHAVSEISSSLRVSYFFIKKTNQKGQSVEPGSGLDTLNPLHYRLKHDRVPRDTLQSYSELTDNCMDVLESDGWQLIRSKTNSIDKLVCLADLKSNHWQCCLKEHSS